MDFRVVRRGDMDEIQKAQDRDEWTDRQISKLDGRREIK
jgi:hypothetical protein